MRPIALGGMLVWVGLLVAACSGGSAVVFGSDAGADAANPPDCPTAFPTLGTRCASEGLRCSYGCNGGAQCDTGAWATTPMGPPCATDSGANDGSRRLADGAIVCGTESECASATGGSFLSCSPGGRVTGCGICFAPQNPCSTDSECLTLDGAAPPKPMVCGPGGPCVCPAGGKSGSCIPACVSANDCGPNLACAAGHCVAKPCTTNGECSNTSTGDYACGASHTCGPKACASDADCGGHYCVDKLCYPQAGICVPPAA